MWRRSYVATSIALGGTLEESLAALGDDVQGAELAELVEGLRSPQRRQRAAALAKALGDVALAVRQSSLR